MHCNLIYISEDPTTEGMDDWELLEPAQMVNRSADYVSDDMSIGDQAAVMDWMVEEKILVRLGPDEFKVNEDYIEETAKAGRDKINQWIDELDDSSDTMIENAMKNDYTDFGMVVFRIQNTLDNADEDTIVYDGDQMVPFSLWKFAVNRVKNGNKPFRIVKVYDYHF